MVNGEVKALRNGLDQEGTATGKKNKKNNKKNKLKGPIIDPEQIINHMKRFNHNSETLHKLLVSQEKTKKVERNSGAKHFLSRGTKI